MSHKGAAALESIPVSETVFPENHRIVVNEAAHCRSFHYIVSHSTTLLVIPLYCQSFHYIVSYSTIQLFHYIVSHSTTLLVISLYCQSFHYIFTSAAAGMRSRELFRMPGKLSVQSVLKPLYLLFFPDCIGILIGNQLCGFYGIKLFIFPLPEPYLPF